MDVLAENRRKTMTLYSFCSERPSRLQYEKTIPNIKYSNEIDLHVAFSSFFIQWAEVLPNERMKLHGNLWNLPR